MAKTINPRKTLFERLTGNKPHESHDKGILDKPVTDFITFNHAQTLLGHAHRGSTERMLHNGSLRWTPVSPENGMARMIYKPDVVLLAKALQGRD